MCYTATSCKFSTNINDHTWKEYIVGPSIDRTRPVGPYCTKCLQTKNQIDRFLHLQKYLNQSVKNQEISELKSIDSLNGQNADMVTKFLIEYTRTYMLTEDDYKYVSGFVLQAVPRCSDSFLVNEYENLFIWHWRILALIQPLWLSTIRERSITGLLSEKIKDSRWVDNNFTKIIHPSITGHGTADPQGCYH